MRELEAEAAVMIRMRHPNVVQVRAAGLGAGATVAPESPDSVTAAGPLCGSSCYWRVSRLSCSPLPQFMGLCQLPPALVTEYCARGSLFDCLQAARKSPASAAELTWARRLAMVSSWACRRLRCAISAAGMVRAV